MQQTVSDIISHTLIVDKSKFICTIAPVKNKTEWEKLYNEILTTYPKAKHYCYGYNFFQSSANIRFHNDQEPNQAAAQPLRQCFSQLNLMNVAIVIVRYFGGIKLGASRLLRTYQAVIKQTIAKVTLIPFVIYNHYQLIVPIKVANQALAKLREAVIIKKEVIHEKLVITFSSQQTDWTLLAPWSVKKLV